MFVDFQKAFGEAAKKRAGFPARVVQEFDKGLPDGAKYYYLEDGSVCIGPAEGEEFTIGGFKPVITEEIEAAIGKNPSVNDLAAYSYNAQKPVRMALVNPDRIVVNGVEVSIGEFVKDPLRRVDVDNESFVLYPTPFPTPFDVIIRSGDGDSSMTLKVQRVPCDDIRTIRFESDDRAPLSVKYELANSEMPDDDVGPRARFSISIKPGRCSSLADVVSVLSIYRSALDGSCEIAGVRMGIPELDQRGDPVDHAMIRWFKKALEVESYLGLQFQPSKIALDNDAARAVEELYVGLVKRESIRIGLHDASVDLSDGLSAEAENELLESANKQIALSYSKPCEFSLFGEKIELLSLCGIFDLAVSRIDESSGGRRLILQSIDGADEGYRGRLLFKDESALEGFLSGTTVSEVMHQLQHAKPLREYLEAE